MRYGHCTILNKKRKQSQKGEFRRREEGSLRSTEIGPQVFVGAKGKVDPRIKSYAWIPKSWSFVKLHEVGNFPIWVISSLKVI